LKRIVISGANGFIGSSLVAFFANHGDVVALARTKPDALPERAVWHTYTLEEGADPSALAGADCVIHCALAVPRRGAPDSDALNARGSAWLRAAAHEAGCRRFVFLSSLSAHPGAKSHYGRSKLAIEGALNPNEDLILRPGLVIGRGGLFARIVDAIATRRVLPLIDGGRQPVQTVAIGDLCRVVDALLASDAAGAYNVAAPETIASRELFDLIAERLGHKPAYLSVPFGVAFAGATIVEAFGWNLPLTSENLLGLRYAHVAPLPDFAVTHGIRLRPAKESVDECVAPRHAAP
jgi:nucleoside-diphosphate-sugar epimerase